MITLPKDDRLSEHDEADSSSLKSRIFRAFSWTMVGHFASLSLRFLGTLVLSRIFTPEVFGILAVVTTLHIVTHLFTDIGISQAIIQSRNGHDRTFLDTAWTLQVIRGVLIWSLCLASAAGLAILTHFDLLAKTSVYAYPDLPIIIVIACFSAVIMGFQTTKVVTANRNLDVKIVTLIDLGAQFIALIFTIVVGLITRSIWSYIVAGLLSSVLTVFISHLWLRGNVNRFAWNRDALRELSRFGRWVFVSSALGGLAGNGDRLVLAGLIAAANLGFYSIANNLVAVVDGVAGRVFGTVALPALSSVARTQPERFPQLYFKIRWLVDAAMIGLAGFIFSLAQVVVDSLYDPRYHQAGAMLRILSFSLIFARFNLAQNAYLALNQPNFLTVLNITKLVSLFTLLPLGFYFFGEQGAIVAIAFHMVPVVFWIFHFNSKYALNNPRLEIVVLGSWPIGWLAGGGVAWSLTAIKEFLLKIVY